MNPYTILSVNRIDKILDTEKGYDNPSDIIADIMHWCDHNGSAFETILNKAQGYYDVDLDLKETEITMEI